jgi:tRNA(adenine34) deaminase|tara:strand:+ start:1614 stop:2066 length:453 start_codon:yes stop_codon:yes gene_type:complete
VKRDLFFMKRALDQAQKAFDIGEVPVGAVLTLDGEIIAESHNKPISTSDPSSHAEINVIREAAKFLKNYRLQNTTLYVTLEPCMMCCGALIHARIENLVFSATDSKSGAVVSRANLLDSDFINHKVNYSQGTMAKESSDLLKRFFSQRRL